MDMSLIAWRRALGKIFGVTHSGKRDMYEEFGYKDELSFDDYYFKFRRQNIARRIINLPANATWSGGVGLSEGGNPHPQSKEWQRILRHSRLVNVFKRADKLAGLGPYAIIVLGFDDASNLEQPLRPRGAKNLMYVQTFSSKSAEIAEFETSTSSPRFGLPNMYLIRSKSEQTQQHTTTAVTLPEKEIRVHHSRVIHIAEDLLENDVYGTPRLEAVYNDLDDLLKVSGGTAETYWLTANRGIQANIDPDIDADSDEMDRLEDELDRYIHRISRVVKTRGVELQNLGTDTLHPRDPFDIIISLIAGTTGIPQRILLGSEAGHLASEQDRTNWATRITERREEYAEPIILRPILERLNFAGVLTLNDVDSLDFTWRDPFSMSPLEQGQAMAQTARAAINLSKQLEKAQTNILTRDECRGILNFGKGETTASEPDDRMPDTSDTGPDENISDTDVDNQANTNDPNADANNLPTGDNE